MMKHTDPTILIPGITFLFLIQLAGTLVESIYILVLMNAALDARALGLLFFFVPVLLVPLHGKYPRLLVWTTFALMWLGRGSLPYLHTAGRMLAAGIGVGAAVSLFLLLLLARSTDQHQFPPGRWGSGGFALAVGLCVLLRAAGSGVDYSLIPSGGWIGWGLGLLLGWLLLREAASGEAPVPENGGGSVTPAVAGFFLVLTLTWFSFTAPSVIARWTESNYTLVVLAVSFCAAGWVLFSRQHPRWIERISPRALLAWNLLFTMALTATILAHRVSFPAAPDSLPVVVGTPEWYQRVPLVLMLVTFPVLFLDMRVFLDGIRPAAPRKLIPGMLLGIAALVLLVFMLIFSNVWGYAEPVSPFFRNKFWLPYLLLAGTITLLSGRVKGAAEVPAPRSAGKPHQGWAVVLGAVFLGSVAGTIPWVRASEPVPERNVLVVMTFNTQQSNDDSGERSFDRQLALIREVSPDVLALQESDSARISLNNNDYVRYFSQKLGYYSYYGPTTVTGTYGTAILSKYPLENTQTVFSFSDQDEIGIAQAQIQVDGRRFTIYNVHPDGSDTAMLAFARTLLERTQNQPGVIALGDFNLRDYEEAYQRIDQVLTNAWVSIYPSEISPDGVDMSGENRIDHIFVSPDLSVRNPVYVLPPDSATDHPVHWAEIYWENP